MCFEQALPSRAIEGQGFLERGPRLVVAAQTAQRHTHAVQDHALVRALAQAACQTERGFVLRERLVESAVLPMHHPERVPQRRLPG